MSVRHLFGAFCCRCGGCWRSLISTMLNTLIGPSLSLTFSWITRLVSIGVRVRAWRSIDIAACRLRRRFVMDWSLWLVVCGDTYRYLAFGFRVSLRFVVVWFLSSCSQSFLERSLCALYCEYAPCIVIAFSVSGCACLACSFLLFQRRIRHHEQMPGCTRVLFRTFGTW